MNPQAHNHPATENLQKWLQPNPRLTGRAYEASNECHILMHKILDIVENDSPELTAGMRHLLQAKDCFVRAVIDESPEYWTDDDKST